ncbi:uncharacterized protein VTP21DRAFT_6964 [Calcarisporiella thermophila]|uniref:uncharacterized protein n=1 Tax=Calcarisporiella thermophila TaxID=911321 RepID=UPI00374387D1
MNFFNIGSKLSTKGKVKKSSAPLPKPLFLMPPYVNASLVKGNFRNIVELPKYVDENEWLAINVSDLVNYINLFYASISDFCTPRDCPSMSAGPGVEYTWTDNQRKAKTLPAPQYVDYVMTSIQNMLEDEDTFPTKTGGEFPKDFPSICRQIFRQCFRVFAHIFHHHYDRLLCLREEAHFNSLFAHFISFAREFNLLDRKEMAPLQELIDHLQRNGVIV